LSLNIYSSRTEKRIENVGELYYSVILQSYTTELYYSYVTELYYSVILQSYITEFYDRANLPENM
jgi:hypothetical protein